MQRVSDSSGPDYNLVRRFYSHPRERTAIDAAREHAALPANAVHCFSVCQYCGFFVPKGIAGIVCCHERAVRHGNAGTVPDPAPAKESRPDWIEAVFAAISIVGTLIVVRKGLGR